MLKYIFFLVLVIFVIVYFWLDANKLISDFMEFVNKIGWKS